MRIRASGEFPAPVRDSTVSREHPVILLLAAIGVVLISGISPTDRGDWLLENLLVAIALPLFVYGRKSVGFSYASLISLFVFLCLHEIGAHYTYSEVPYREWLHTLSGTSTKAIHLEGRNHFDRVVHFAYGLLVMPAVLELFARRAPPRGLWRWLMPLTFVMAHSMTYELVEWAAAAVFGGELGQAYLGTQGDPWDAQKDMALATLGSIAALVLLTALRWTPRNPGTDAGETP